MQKQTSPWAGLCFYQKIFAQEDPWPLPPRKASDFVVNFTKRMASEVRVKSLEVREGMESLNRKRENGDDTLAALFLREPVTLFRFRKYFHIVCIIFSLTSQADALAKENHAWFGREWFLTACRRLCFADG